jgi:transcription initiation factor IIE alpha subunit
MVGNELRVMKALLVHLDGRAVCDPTDDEIAAETGLTVAEVSRSITRLQNAGAIKCV